MRFEFMIIICFWFYMAIQLVQNFEGDLENLSWWRVLVLEGILVFFAPIFLIEEILEMIIDWVIGDEE